MTQDDDLTSEGGHGHKDGDDDGELAVHYLGKPHGDGLRAQDLGDAERGVEGDVGEGVDHRDQDDRDADGPGQVPHRVLELLDHKVEVVPAVVSKQPRVEGQGQFCQVCFCVVPREVLSLS